MKTTKRALFSSVMALILCFSMLVGTTFAWFTDEVKSGTNQIVAGNLDVNLYHTDAKVANDPVTVDTKLFDDVEPKLWEPGALAYEILTVANEGTLALKYQLAINFENATVVNGHSLVEALKVAVVDAEKLTSREAAIAAAAGKWQELKSFVLPGELAGVDEDGKIDSKTYGIVIYWEPTDKDNDFNVKGGALSIDLGVNLFATQMQAEIDSFGKDYDAGAYVTNEDFKEAVTSNAKVINVSLAEDVTYDVAAWENEAMGGEVTETIIINGNGHTITFNHTNSDWNNIVTNGAKLIINNAHITNAGKNNGPWNRHDLNFACEVELNNVTSDKAMAFKAAATLNNVVISDANTADTYAIWIQPNGQTVTLNGCTIDMLACSDGRGIKIDEQYVDVPAEVTLNVSNTTFKTEEKAAILVKSAAGAEINLSNVDITNTPDPVHAVWVDEDSKASYDLVTVNGGKKFYEGDVVSSSTGLNKALANGETEIILAPGNYQFPLSANLKGKTLTLIGTKGVVIDASNVNQNNQFVTGANLKFEGVTLNFGTAIYMGFANTASLTYKDCAVNGLQFVCGTGTVSFENCDLNSNGAEHSLWTWGISNISFTGCDFTYGDRAVNCYAEHGQTTNASFTDCTFTKVAGKEITGAIETNSSLMTALNLTINNCSINEGDLWWVSTWDSKGGANTHTTVDGKVQVDSAKQLAAVVAKGATDIYLLDGEYNVANCGGKTLTLTGSKNAVLKVMNEGEDGCDYGFGGPAGVGNITFNGLTIDTTANTGNYKGYAYMKGTFNDCNFVGAYSLNNANDFVFNRCTFDFKNGYFWTWGAKSVTFDGCTFNGNSKAILAHGSASTVININNCKFAATEKGYTGAGDNTAVVEMDPVGSNTYTINFTGENTITDAYAGWTRVKDSSTGHTITGLN